MENIEQKPKLTIPKKCLSKKNFLLKDRPVQNGVGAPLRARHHDEGQGHRKNGQGHQKESLKEGQDHPKKRQLHQKEGQGHLERSQIRPNESQGHLKKIETRLLDVGNQKMNLDVKGVVVDRMIKNLIENAGQGHVIENDGDKTRIIFL